MVIGIDVGYGRTKAYAGIDKEGRGITTDFSSVFKETNDRYEIANRGDYMRIELEGKAYYVGQYAVTNHGSSVFNKEDMLRHKICVLTAIARIVKGNYTGEVALGLPIDDMDNLTDKLLGLVGKYDFVYNGENRKIEITKIHVFPQGVTVFDEMADYEDDLKDIIGIVDIGQKTVDVAWYENGIPNMDYSGSDDTLGCAFVYQKITKEIKNVLGYQLKEYQVPERIKRSEVASVAEPFFRDFANEINETLIRMGWNYNEIDRIVLVGGGSFFVSKYLKEIIPCVEAHENAAYANACGFYTKAGGE